MANVKRRGRSGGIAGAGVGRGRRREGSSAAGTTVRHTIDLNSRSATHIANVSFLPARQHNFPIVQFDCVDCPETGDHIRGWQQDTDPPDIRDLLRHEDQELNLTGPPSKGIMTLLEGAATFSSSILIPISIIALHLPNNTRFHFFWTPHSPSPLLTDLTLQGLIGPPQVYTEGTPRYSSSGAPLPPRRHTLYTLLKQNFLVATSYPDAPAFRDASLLSDMCPRVRNPSDAHRRIEAEDNLHPAKSTRADKDLGDDRYILELEPAERSLACLVELCCSEYLLLKRRYFKAFSRECVTLSSKIRMNAARQTNLRRMAMTTAGHRANDGKDEEGTATAESDDAENSLYDDEDENDNNKEQGQEQEKEADPENSPNAKIDTPHTTPRTRRQIRATTVVTTATSDNETCTPTPTPTPNARRARRHAAAAVGARMRAQRVRTFNAHVREIEAVAGWAYSRSKRLVLGWEMLGFLDERRVLAVAEGEESESEGESEDDEGDDGGEGEREAEAEAE